MGLKRRDFLQRTGLALAALTAGEFGLPPIAQQYQQALAEPTSRKLALLVGINQYRHGALSGCVTDVELQRELLIYRFGFQPQDILTLTNQQATREGIETAFVAHLIDQAQAGDVVVFHFSGYGGRVKVNAASNPIQTSLVPVDDLVIDQETPAVNDLLEDTLWLLLRSLRTSKVTTVLDTSYIYPGKPLQGNLRVRARPISTIAQSGEAALEAQKKLIDRVPIKSPQPGILPFPRSDFPGIVLAAAGPEQLATEAHWSGVNAGLFTYALTQQIWQATSSTALRVILGRTKEQVEQLASQEQQPQLSGQKSKDSPLSPYRLPPVPGSGADGVLMGVDENGKTAQVWLGGLPVNLLEQLGTNSLLAMVNGSEKSDPPTYLQLLSKDGLTAKARLYPSNATLESAETLPPLEAGQFVREQVRVLPRNIGLTVALDSNLERIERVDAISAFTAIPRVSPVIAGEQSADYLFSKIQTLAQTQVASTASLAGIASGSTTTQSSYGLFSLGQDVIPNTAGEGGEAIKVAVRRLVPKLQALLAGKLLNLTVNEKSSLLAVRATLERLDPKAQPLQRRETLPVTQANAGKGILALSGTPVSEGTNFLGLPLNSRVQYRLENQSPSELYYILLGLDSGGNLVSLYTPSTQSTNSADVKPTSPNTEPLPNPTTNKEWTSGKIAPGEILTLPPASPTFQWVLHGPAGIAETFIICSRAPFTQTLRALGTAIRPTDDAPALHILGNPLDIAHAVLLDLHQASNPSAQTIGASPDTFALDMSAWASLRFIYQIVG